MSNEPAEQKPESYPVEEPISLSNIIGVLRRYATVIALVLGSVMLLYAIGATAAILLRPSQRVTSMPFRLEFKGAEAGQYPNGLRFSTTDITSTPVLLDVYNTNALRRFLGFDAFSRSVIIVQTNQALQRLLAEYQAKLSDTKLTPVDRDRLEREFESRRASISKADYLIQFVEPTAARRIPPSLRAKILHEVLAVWARKAAVEKRAMKYQVPVLSTNLVSVPTIESDDLLLPLLLLRKRMYDLKDNVTEISLIPGAVLVRTGAERRSITEISLAIDEILRFRIEPMTSSARNRVQGGPTGSATEFVRTSLLYDRRVLEGARRRELALRQSLAAYESPNADAPVSTAQSAESERGGETVMPQLTDSFLDRIVGLADRSADREYRQQLTDEIKDAALAVVPAELAVQYDEELIEALQRPQTASSLSDEKLLQDWRAVVTEVRQLVEQMNEIYHLASRNLYPETELFSTLGPAAAETQYSVSLTRIVTGGMLTFLIALPLTLIGVMLHNRVREEAANTHNADAA